MEQQSYTLEQEVAWCRKIIRNAAIRANRKHARWAREELTLNNVTDDGSEVLDVYPSEAAEQAFRDTELLIALEVLLERERLVIQRIYTDGDTQREIARDLGITQSQVSKVHQRALRKLRRMIQDELHINGNSPVDNSSSTRG